MDDGEVSGTCIQGFLQGVLETSVYACMCVCIVCVCVFVCVYCVCMCVCMCIVCVYVCVYCVCCGVRWLDCKTN